MTFTKLPKALTAEELLSTPLPPVKWIIFGADPNRKYCHPQDAVKLQAANLMQDLLNSQNPCYVAFMKNRNRKPKKAG